MKLPLVRTAVFSFLAAGVLALAAGCSSSTNEGKETADFCSTLTSYLSRCKITNACAQAEATACDSHVSVYSSTYLSLLASCTSAQSCADGGEETGQPCTVSTLAQVAPSAVQSKLANDYCAACAASAGQTAAACEASFFHSDLSADTGVVDGDFILLPYNDTITAQLGASCGFPAGDASASPLCGAAFSGCIVNAAATLSPPPAACTTTIGTSGAADGG